MDLLKHTKHYCLSCIHPEDAINKPWEFFYRGVLCIPWGSETVRSGYSTQRIPVKDTVNITHSAIIRSYLKLGLPEGLQLQYTCRGEWLISESNGCAEKLRAEGDAAHSVRGGVTEGFICQPGDTSFYSQIFFLLSVLYKESP